MPEGAAAPAVPASNGGRPHDPAAGDRLRLLREEVGKLLREVPGTVTSVSASVADCAVHITWAAGHLPAGRSAPVPAESTAPAPPGSAPHSAGAPPAAPEHLVCAPMVGTFYRAPEPGAPPFVEVGDRVVAGQTVGIIEAMKLMNSIDAECSGTVTGVLVAEGEPVEFAQPLVRIAADAG